MDCSSSGISPSASKPPDIIIIIRRALRKLQLVTVRTYINLNFNQHKLKNNNREDDASEDGVLLRYALEFFYLWVTFAPLSRGR